MVIDKSISGSKLTNMVVDPNTKYAFITDKKGKIQIFDFKEVRENNFGLLCNFFRMRLL